MDKFPEYGKTGMGCQFLFCYFQLEWKHALCHHYFTSLVILVLCLDNLNLSYQRGFLLPTFF